MLSVILSLWLTRISVSNLYSVKLPESSCRVTRPTATPAAAAERFTPASMSAKLPPHTDAMEDDPGNYFGFIWRKRFRAFMHDKQTESLK